MFALRLHRFFLIFFVFTLFVVITADYSPYYIPNGDVFFPITIPLLLFTVCQDFLDYKKTVVVISYFIVCLFVFCFHFLYLFQPPNVLLMSQLVFACSFLYLKDDVRLWIYDKFIRIIAILLCFAIIEYLLICVGISFSLGESIRPANGNRFYQCLLNLEPYYLKSFFFRFQFITEEPGLIGTLCIFLLATIDKNKYKKETVVFAIAGVITFSLAFYLLCFLWGVSKLRLSNFKFILLPLALYAAFYEPINEQIVDRFIYGVEDGSIDNRNSIKTKNIYDKMCDNGEIVLGMGFKTFYGYKTQYKLGSTSGLKTFLIQYGLVGFILVFSSFTFVFFRYNKFTYSNVVIFALFWISFYQRCDLNFEPNIVILFSYGLIEKKQTLMSV